MWPVLFAYVLNDLCLKTPKGGYGVMRGEILCSGYDPVMYRRRMLDGTAGEFLSIGCVTGLPS